MKQIIQDLKSGATILEEVPITHMRRLDIDMLKGLAIISVVLYHAGFLDTGYLGVDMFLVISGYLTIPSVIRRLENNNWEGYLSFVLNRVVRLYPVVFIACFACLLTGVYGMLPDDFENLSESIIATEIMSNNILAYLTVGNYWDVWNEYKPLMHTWYLGILVEFYIFIPLLVMIGKKVERRGILAMVALLTFISLAIYLMPYFSDPAKFYLLPFRFFEFGIGGLLAICSATVNKRNRQNSLGIVLLIGLMVVVCSAWLPGQIDKVILLLSVVVLTTTVIYFDLSGISNNLIGYIGKMSLSVYIWHQIILAFWRYYFGKDIGIGTWFLLLGVLSVLSLLSYHLIENKVSINKKSILTMAIVWSLIFTSSMGIYMNAGIIRDVPELDLKVNEAHRGMFKDYSDKIYAMDKDFEEDGKIKVLVLGNSFARDWANILLESKYKDSISISYAHDQQSGFDEKIKKRAPKADVIFVNSLKEEVPVCLWTSKKEDVRVWCIGNKNFGESNGIFYTHRNEPDYMNQSVICSNQVIKDNIRRKQDWGDSFIDLMSPVTTPKGEIRVFTPEGKFISMDTRHLTKAGAQYYTRLLEIEKYINKDR